MWRALTGIRSAGTGGEWALRHPCITDWCFAQASRRRIRVQSFHRTTISEAGPGSGRLCASTSTLSRSAWEKTRHGTIVIIDPARRQLIDKAVADLASLRCTRVLAEGLQLLGELGVVPGCSLTGVGGTPLGANPGGARFASTCPARPVATTDVASNSEGHQAK